ncbi:Ser/Thr protein kinase RdoA (MazF antagonist) [Sporosarcina luteola]|nr:Ser/Thr protein kinase RdoA (MazF antagonist) [Sporosarcina luteola]
MISNVMKNFIKEPLTSHEVLRDKERLVAEVVVNGSTYYLKGEKIEKAFLERLIAFIREAGMSGLPYIGPEKTLDGADYVEHDGLLFILERKGKGAEVEGINLRQIEEIACLMGKEHALSLSRELRLGRGTSWGMFGGNATEELGDYDENELCFQDLMRTLEENGSFLEELELIRRLYESRREALEQVWGDLPIGATQGDLAPYNMLFDGNRISAVYDYNIAGDERLVNGSVASAIYLAWHYDGFKGEESAEERYEAFLAAYTRERPFTELELQVIPDLFAVIRPFRYDRVENGIEQIKQGEGKQFIEETISLLQS